MADAIEQVTPLWRILTPVIFALALYGLFAVIEKHVLGYSIVPCKGTMVVTELSDLLHEEQKRVEQARQDVALAKKDLLLIKRYTMLMARNMEVTFNTLTARALLQDVVPDKLMLQTTIDLLRSDIAEGEAVIKAGEITTNRLSGAIIKPKSLDG